MTQNPARTITVPGVACEPIRKGVSISNIRSGFKASRISPLNKTVFKDSDFAAFEITNRPETAISTDEAEMEVLRAEHEVTLGKNCKRDIRGS